MIEIKQLTKHYQNQTTPSLKDVTLTISQGEIFGIIGESGAGKSTLLHCINLLERPSSGSIKINGVEITHLTGKALREERRKIGVIFQHFNLVYSKTVFENVALPLRLTKVKKADLKEKVLRLLEIVGLTDKAHAYPAELSGGQQQRVAIARALANEPDVLLCDEATSALDPNTTQTILSLLKSINEQFGLTIVLITHQMDVIKQIADRVAILKQGELVECDDVLTIFTHPKTVYTQRLIKTTLKLDLPENISTSLQSTHTEHTQYSLVRFTFIGKTTSKPFLSELTEKFNVHCSVLQANIDLIHGNPMGIMLVQLKATPVLLKEIVDYATEQHLQAEIVGYVN